MKFIEYNITNNDGKSNCVSDLQHIIKYAKSNYDEINLWACSMGAYFSLLTYKNKRFF